MATEPVLCDFHCSRLLLLLVHQVQVLLIFPLVSLRAFVITVEELPARKLFTMLQRETLSVPAT